MIPFLACYKNEEEYSIDRDMALAQNICGHILMVEKTKMTIPSTSNSIALSHWMGRPMSQSSERLKKMQRTHSSQWEILFKNLRRLGDA